MFKSIDKLIEGANNQIDKLASGVSKVASKVIVDPSLPYGILWEASENVNACRYCQKAFQMPLLKVKHHCRSCAGVYCGDCSSEVEKNDESLRICIGCKNGEIPSEQFIKNVRKDLEKHNNREKRIEGREKRHTQSEKTFEQIGSVLVKVGDTLGVQQDIGIPPSVPISLHRGSAYNDKVTNGKGVPLSGYFEIINKSNGCIAIKVLLPGGNIKLETVRPSYFVIPPSALMHGFFESDNQELQIIILFDNPCSIPNSNIVYDTRAPGAKAELMSDCAKVSKFRNYSMFSIPCKDKNVLLKVKNDGIIEARKGDSIGRVGLFGKLQGHRFIPDHLDYSTNVQSINTIKR